ncbi:hypothetical protein, partial [Metaclostridioides mangenotii]
MQELKPLARISKSKLKSILGLFKKSAKEVKTSNNYACESCMFKNDPSLNKNSLELFCANKCTNNNYDTELTFYETKETELGIFEIISNNSKCITLSKSAIKQYILYHFIPTNKNLVRKAVSFKDIASLCSVSIPTARTNHKTLEEVGLVYSTKNSYGKLDIVVDDEYKNHFKKDKNGNGYFTMSLDILEHLLSFENVNEMKLEIKKIIWADAKTSKLGKRISFKKDNLIKVLPDYVRKSNKVTEAVLNNSETLLDIKYNTINTYNYKTKLDTIKEIKESYRATIKEFFDSTGYSISENYSKVMKDLNYEKYIFRKEEMLQKLEIEKALTIEDITNLALQYGIHRILEVLHYIFKEHSITEDEVNCTDIKNPGAFIRQVIVNNINEYGSLNI